MDKAFLMSGMDIGLVFQPIISFQNGDIDSYEVLVRFIDQDPRDTQATVNDLEHSGRALLLDRRVSLKVLDLLNDPTFLGGYPLSINITGHSLSSKTFLSWFESFVGRLNNPSRLIVEQTETLPITNLEQAHRFFSFCASKGIALFMDDFGTGHNDELLLKTLPYQGAKLDGSFVLKWHEGGYATRKAEELAIVGDRLGLILTAEFISGDEDIHMAKSMGYHNGQGYALGSPEEAPVSPPILIDQLHQSGHLAHD